MRHQRCYIVRSRSLSPKACFLRVCGTGACNLTQNARPHHWGQADGELTAPDISGVRGTEHADGGEGGLHIWGIVMSTAWPKTRLMSVSQRTCRHPEGWLSRMPCLTCILLQKEKTARTYTGRNNLGSDNLGHHCIGQTIQAIIK